MGVLSVRQIVLHEWSLTGCSVFLSYVGCFFCEYNRLRVGGSGGGGGVWGRGDGGG